MMEPGLQQAFSSSPDGWADLHVHTNVSDGVDGPEFIIQKAARLRLQAVAITDHDAVGGIQPAQQKGKELGIEIIPGIELSTFDGQYDIHILGYFIDASDEGIRNYVLFLQDERRRRAEKIVQKLHEMGVRLRVELVWEKAGRGSIGRPHIAEALMEEGYVLSYDEAFYRYLAEGKPAYVPKYKISPREGIELIHRAGGLAFIAHPGMGLNLDVLINYIRIGIDGIEIQHPKHSLRTINELYQLAIKQGLLVSGGSDSHGERNGEDTMGLFNVPYQFVKEMKKTLALMRKDS